MDQIYFWSKFLFFTTDFGKSNSKIEHYIIDDSWKGNIPSDKVLLLKFKIIVLEISNSN